MELNKYIDHTNLKPNCTKEDIKKLCSEAIFYNFASVCVNPSDVKQAFECLANSKVEVCTVIGFPLGKNTTEIKVEETKRALLDGCDELDMVINVGDLKEKLYDKVQYDISQVVKAAQGRTLKVILQTDFLDNEEIAIATKISCAAEASFVKTCTGFSHGIATVEHIKIMKQNVFGGVRIKASAGIKTLAMALELIEAGADRLGTSAGVEIMEENRGNA